MTSTGLEGSRADDAFGADLYALLAADGTDLAFSPVSIASALRMALWGARGTTATELAAALHESDGGDVDSLSPVTGELAADTDLTFRAPNTMWVQTGLPLEPAFAGKAHETGVAVRPADFAHAPEVARAEINQLIEEQTAGKITDLLPRRTVGAATRLVLANAIYLKAQWAHPFPKQVTSNAPFYPAGPNGEPATVRMMHREAMREYVSGDGYQAVLLPYTDDRLAMAVFLPDGPLTALRPLIAKHGIQGLLTGPSRRRVALSMPKFRLRSRFDLIPPLGRLGVHQAFSKEADFSGITKATRLVIDMITHVAYVDVDESGTEAAAATAVGMRPMVVRRPPTPVTMVVDRPFLFAIIDTPTGLPFFLGQVTRPGT